MRAPAAGPVRPAAKPEPIRLPEIAAEPPGDETFLREPIRAPSSEPSPAVSPASVAFNLNTCSAEDLVSNVPGCSAALAAAIIAQRDKIGTYARLEDLLEVPGMTKSAYRGLTGESPAENRGPMTLNELLGFPKEQHLSLKDVTERISCWPDVTGCLLSQSSGLSLVGSAPKPQPGSHRRLRAAHVRRDQQIVRRKSPATMHRRARSSPPTGTSFHLFRNKNLYLIIMSRLPQMPERHVKVARYVLAALSHSPGID